MGFIINLNCWGFKMSFQYWVYFKDKRRLPKGLKTNSLKQVFEYLIFRYGITEEDILYITQNGVKQDLRDLKR